MGKIHVTPKERGLYLLALAALASADAEVSAEEVAFIRKRCHQLRCKVRKGAFQHHDLEAIIEGIGSRPVRESLLRDLASLAGADRWRGEETRVIRTLADRWGLPTPPMPDVDWDSIQPLDEAELRTESERQRERIAGRHDLQKATDPMALGCILLLGLTALLPGVGLIILAVCFPEHLGKRHMSLGQAQLLAVCSSLPFVLVGGLFVFGSLRAMARGGLPPAYDS